MVSEINTEGSRRCCKPHFKCYWLALPLCTASLFHCSASLLSPNVVRSGSSVNYSASQEGRGTWWWWGLGAGSQTIKPGSRPPALFNATIPALFYHFLSVSCISCPFRGSKCCWLTWILSRLLGCLCSCNERPWKQGKCCAKRANKYVMVMNFDTDVIWFQLDVYLVASSMHYTVVRVQ